MKQIKCVTVGDEETQKTRLLIAYTTDASPGEYIPTVFDNFSKNLLCDDTTVNMTIYDTSSLRDYEKLRPLSYPSTDVFIATFHIAKPITLESVETYWIPEVTEYCPGKPIILVATCTEYLDDPNLLEEGDRIIEDKEVLKMMKKFPIIYDYIKCSALKKRNLDLAFETAARAVIRGNRTSEPANISIGDSNKKCKIA